MTPEERAKFDKMGRTLVWDYLQAPGLQESTRKAIYEWISDDDRACARRNEASRDEQMATARSAKNAAWIAAVAAIIAAIAAVAPLVK